MKCKNQYRDIEKYKEYKRRYQAKARKRGGAGLFGSRPWSVEEDLEILKIGNTDRELSKKIQRSVGAIQKRRYKLKHEG